MVLPTSLDNIRDWLALLTSRVDAVSRTVIIAILGMARQLTIPGIRKPPSWLNPASYNNFQFFFGKQSCFSNFYPCEFVIKGQTFNCVEQFYLSSQAAYFNNQSISKQIMNCKEGADMKRLSRGISISQYIKVQKWYPIAPRFMFRVVLAKFSQNNHLKKELLATGTKCLVEANPKDLFWGIGLGATQAESVPPNRWVGHNMLGRVLMGVRYRLAHPRKPKKGAGCKKRRQKRRKALKKLLKKGLKTQ